MDTLKEQLLSYGKADREKIIAFFSRFLQAKSPDPPGDTVEVEEFIDFVKIQLIYAKP